VKLDFPDYLSQDFRVLERYGAAVRSKHGKGTKRNIRFCDEKLALYMDVKIPTDLNWMKVTVEMAADLLEEDDQRTGRVTRNKLRQKPNIQPATSLEDDPILCESEPRTEERTRTQSR
jgi:hypothetical protein